MSSLLSVRQHKGDMGRSSPAPCHCVPACAIPQLASRDNIGKFNTANFPQYIFAALSYARAAASFVLKDQILPSLIHTDKCLPYAIPFAPRHASISRSVVHLDSGLLNVLGMREYLQIRFPIVQSVAAYVVYFSCDQAIAMMGQNRSMHEFGLTRGSSSGIPCSSTLMCMPFEFRQPFEIFCIHKRDLALSQLYYLWFFG